MSLVTTNLTLDLLGILVALVCVTVAYLKWSMTYWKRMNVPYSEPKFPFGNLSNPLSKHRRHNGEQLEEVYMEARARGLKCIGMYFMTSPGILLADLDYVKLIMTKDFNNFSDRGLYYNEKTDPISAHLISISGSKWRNLRRKVTPTFSTGKMKSMFPILLECGKLLETEVAIKAKSKEAVDIKDMLEKFTMDIIGSCAFGLECNSFEDDNSPFRVYGKRIFTSSVRETFRRIVCISFPHIARALGVRVFDAEISKFFYGVVNDSIKYREENNIVRKDFLQLVMDMKSKNNEYKGDGNELTMDEIVAQCFVFFAAGYETSATTMTFTLYELARHQTIQDKLRKEINDVLKKHNNELTYEVLNDMTYLSQVLDESLRIHPPIPNVPRVCLSDYKLPESNIVVKKGMRVIIPIMGIQHDPKHFDNPLEYNPDRFSPENKQKIDQFAYIPFGEGSRNCIGLRFGLMQSKLGLISLIKNHRLTLNERTRVPLRIAATTFVQSPADGVWIHFEKVS